MNNINKHVIVIIECEIHLVHVCTVLLCFDSTNNTTGMYM